MLIAGIWPAALNDFWPKRLFTLDYSLRGGPRRAGVFFHERDAPGLVRGVERVLDLDLRVMTPIADSQAANHLLARVEHF